MRISYSLQAIGQKVADILAASGLNVSKWSGSNVAAPNVAGYPLVDTKYHLGSAENALQSGRRDVYVGAVAAGVITPLHSSIQQGTVTIVGGAGNVSATAVITSVTTTKAFVVNLGYNESGVGTCPDVRLDLQDATHVRAQIGLAVGANVDCNFAVIEFN